MQLPDSVTSLLKSKRFLHLATCNDNVPHLSLMNYTYYKKTDNEHYIIMSTPKNTDKYNNMLANPQVSVLVHDWLATNNKASGESDAEDLKGRRNLLYDFLVNLNQSEISRVSVMINGKCQLLDKTENKDTYEFYKSLHRNNKKFDEVQVKNYIEDDEDNALVVIAITLCKVTDTNNNVETY
ncbi:uncharacterized protein KQ657_004889 [Scheffersomyces spartinae]|uniref:Pyridoxamine 5'-phosphate oxidase N-terminal domain-containing protein n=1 Tax=Scheffersomyces spartinae TaxID=45513 RepID=A0A9P7VAF7_9ASCO|nr:uncharacterized protein KQ657_004889 [Scheffersomyces spartinae]KAG7194180.1 hypothetical protein KQ657_004889 [Scheffersomyces spartinae]